LFVADAEGVLGSCASFVIAVYSLLSILSKVTVAGKLVMKDTAMKVKYSARHCLHDLRSQRQQKGWHVRCVIDTFPPSIYF